MRQFFKQIHLSRNLGKCSRLHEQIKTATENVSQKTRSCGISRTITQDKLLIPLGSNHLQESILHFIQAESFPNNLTKLDIRHSSGHPSAFRVISLCLQSLRCLGLSDPLFEGIQPEADKRRVFASLQAVRILEFSYCSSLTDLMVRYIAEYCR